VARDEFQDVAGGIVEVDLLGVPGLRGELVSTILGEQVNPPGEPGFRGGQFVLRDIEGEMIGRGPRRVGREGQAGRARLHTEAVGRGGAERQAESFRVERAQCPEIARDQLEFRDLHCPLAGADLPKFGSDVCWTALDPVRQRVSNAGGAIR